MTKYTMDHFGEIVNSSQFIGGVYSLAGGGGRSFRTMPYPWNPPRHSFGEAALWMAVGEGRGSYRPTLGGKEGAGIRKGIELEQGSFLCSVPDLLNAQRQNHSPTASPLSDKGARYFSHTPPRSPPEPLYFLLGKKCYFFSSVGFSRALRESSEKARFFFSRRTLGARKTFGQNAITLLCVDESDFTNVYVPVDENG